MERIKDKFIRLAIVGAIAGVGIVSNFGRSSEVRATTANTVESAYTLRDFEQGIQISYRRLLWNRYEPIFMIGFGNYEIPYFSTCNIEPDEYGDNCHYLISEARSWSKFTPITHELWDQSIRWEVQSDGSFGRAVLNQSYLPVVSKRSQ